MMQKQQQQTNQWIFTPEQLNCVSFIFVTHLIRDAQTKNMLFHSFLQVYQVPKISQVYHISQVSGILLVSQLFQLSQGFSDI